MGKSNAVVKPAVDLREQAQVPEGFEKQNSDIVGFYNNAGIIKFSPQFVNLDDSDLDNAKPSILMFAILIDEASCFVDKDGNQVDVMPGETIGIWYKPGMRVAAKHCGHEVYMVPSGEVDTGKPNAMRVFDCYSPAKPDSPVPVLEDRRKRSKAAKTPFTSGGTGRAEF